MTSELEARVAALEAALAEHARAINQLYSIPAARMALGVVKMVQVVTVAPNQQGSGEVVSKISQTDAALQRGRLLAHVASKKT